MTLPDELVERAAKSGVAWQKIDWTLLTENQRVSYKNWARAVLEAALSEGGQIVESQLGGIMGCLPGRYLVIPLDSKE